MPQLRIFLLQKRIYLRVLYFQVFYFKFAKQVHLSLVFEFEEREFITL